MKFDVPFSGLIPGAKGAVLAALLRTGKPMTGRHVSSMVGDGHSLWAVQVALKELVSIGLVKAETYGRSVLHRLNERHALVPSLRTMAQPVEVLGQVVRDASDGAEAVILFGSIARGEAEAASDVDLAVVAPAGWGGKSVLQEAIWNGLGNDCDVLVFTRDEYLDKAEAEPVVAAIKRDGIALLGTMPRRRRAA